MLRNSLRTFPSVLAFLIGPALVTLFLIQSLAFAGTSDAAFRAGIAHEFAGLPQERAAVALARTFPKSIAAYGAGLLFVQGVAGPGERFNYFFGEISGRGYALYFPVALGIKLTTAAVLLVLAALVTAGVLAARGTRFRGLLAARACFPATLGGARRGRRCGGAHAASVPSAQGRGPLPAYFVRSSVPSIPSASGSRTWATLFSITSV
jgi:hypothetical protein